MQVVSHHQTLTGYGPSTAVLAGGELPCPATERSVSAVKRSVSAVKRSVSAGAVCLRVGLAAATLCRASAA